MTRGDGTAAASGAGQAVQPQDVILRDAGANPGAVAEVVRSMTGLEPAAVTELLAKMPCAVRTRISPALSEALRSKLVAAGGRVEVRAHVPPPELFDVFLRGHGSGKINVIRAVKMLLGLDLREAIELVDEAPCLLKRKVDREEAETFRHELVEAGAELEIRDHDPSTPEPPPRALARVEAIAAAGEALAAAEGPGPFAVILQQCGPNKISVIKAIRAATGLGLKESKDLAESTKVAIRSGLSASEATALQRELAGLGAVVEVRAEGAPVGVTAAASPVTASRVDVVLRECGPRKINVIKVIREWTALGLKEAKDMSEAPGSVVKAGVDRSEAEKLERQLVEAGAVVELRPHAAEEAAAEDAEAAADGAERVDVFLRSYGANKIVVIKEVRALTGLGLKDAKDLVEAAPTMIREDVDRETASRLQQMLEAFGAVVELR